MLSGDLHVLLRGGFRPPVEGVCRPDDASERRGGADNEYVRPANRHEDELQ